MNCTVRLFARAKDLAGAETVVVVVPDRATIAELRRRLAVAVPKLASLAERSAFAVNNEFADDASLLSADAEVAIIPPVSGG